MFLKNPWIILFIAGLFEVLWAVGIKYTHGFSKLLPSLLTLFFLAISMLLLAKASQSLPIGTAYAVWVGIGAFGTAVLGIFLFQEPLGPLRALCLVGLLASIIGLKFLA